MSLPTPGRHCEDQNNPASLDYSGISALKNNVDPPTIIPSYSVSLVLQVVLFPFAGVKGKKILTQNVV